MLVYRVGDVQCDNLLRKIRISFFLLLVPEGKEDSSLVRTVFAIKGIINAFSRPDPQNNLLVEGLSRPDPRNNGYHWPTLI